MKMELIDAILERHSVRKFLPQKVPKEVIKFILEVSTYAMSANNSQPWEFIVVTGKKLDWLREFNIQALREGQVPDRLGYALSGIYKSRAKELGKQLFSALNISRQDLKKREKWIEWGFRFFDAPVLILLCMDESLDETNFRFDLGCISQLICLVAAEQGLGTCVQEQAIMYQQGIRSILQLPENKRLICGIAMGYADDESPANQVVTTRVPVQEITQWIGYDGEI